MLLCQKYAKNNRGSFAVKAVQVKAMFPCGNIQRLAGQTGTKCSRSGTSLHAPSAPAASSWPGSEQVNVSTRMLGLSQVGKVRMLISFTVSLRTTAMARRSSDSSGQLSRQSQSLAFTFFLLSGALILVPQGPHLVYLAAVFRLCRCRYFQVFRRAAATPATDSGDTIR